MFTKESCAQTNLYKSIRNIYLDCLFDFLLILTKYPSYKSHQQCHLSPSSTSIKTKDSLAFRTSDMRVEKEKRLRVYIVAMRQKTKVQMSYAEHHLRRVEELSSPSDTDRNFTGAT